MAFPTRNSVIRGKQEGTYGTDPTTGVADAILTLGQPVIQPQLHTLEAEEMAGTLGEHHSHAGKRWAKLTFDTFLRSSGTAHEGTVEPRLSRWFQACGFTQTTGGTGQVGWYRLAQSSDWTNHKSIWVDGYYGGGDDVTTDTVKYVLSGGRGSFSFASVAGEIPKLSFEMNGLYTATAATTWPATNTFETTTPMVGLGVAWTGLDSTMTANTAFLEFNFDMGIEAVPQDSAGVTTGVNRTYLTKWSVSGNLVLQANIAMIPILETEITARTGKALQVTYVQPDDANEYFLVKFASLMWEGMYDLGDKDGIRVVNMPFKAYELTGDDTVTMQFGAPTIT